MAADYLEILQRGSDAARPMAAAPPLERPKKKRTKKQIAASLRNLRRAQLVTARRRNERKAKKARRLATALANLKKAHAKQGVRANRAAKASGRGSGLTPGEEARSTEERGKGGMKGKTKKKRSKKQIAASMRNLAKARAKLRAKAHGGKKKTKTKGRTKPRAASMTKRKSTGVKKKSGVRAAPKVPRALRPSGHRKAAKRPTGHRSRKQTPAQYRASLRNLAKARGARRAATKRHPVRPYKYKVGTKRVHVPAHLSREAGRKQTPAQRKASLANLRKARSAQKHRGHRKGHRKQTPAQYRASLANLRKARAARKSATRRHPVRSYGYTRKGGTRHVKKHLSWESMYSDNPLTGVELFVGGFSGIVWFMLTDLVDRIVATHDLTDKGTTDAAGHELYADNPPTSGDYAGVFNPTAIAAPMNAWRWLAGIGMTGVPLLLAHFMENGMAKTVFQAGGFGGAMRIGGKAAIDLVAYVTMWTQFGQRLYDGEMRAQVLASNDQTPLSSLPSAGLGSAGKECECGPCKAGVGACEGSEGTGWPGYPRETAAGAGGATPPAPPAPPPGTTTTTTSSTSTTGPSPLKGTPELPAARVNPYAWGEKEDREAA